MSEMPCIPPERRILMAGPLSKGARFSLTVEGNIGAREIKNMITFLQLQLEWMAEDEAISLAAEKVQPHPADEGSET